MGVQGGQCPFWDVPLLLLQETHPCPSIAPPPRSVLPLYPAATETGRPRTATAGRYNGSLHPPSLEDQAGCHQEGQQRCLPTWPGSSSFNIRCFFAKSWLWLKPEDPGRAPLLSKGQQWPPPGRSSGSVWCHWVMSLTQCPIHVSHQEISGYGAALEYGLTDIISPRLLLRIQQGVLK